MPHAARQIFVAVLLACLAPCALAQDAPAQRPAPELTLKDVGGRVRRLSDYRGKVVLLNFWATWCPPCRAEMPDLVRWQRQYRARGLQVIGVTQPPASLPAVRKFTRRLRVNYPILLGTADTKAGFDGGEVLPLTVVIGRDGKVRAIIEGILLPEEFREQIEPLLKPAAAAPADPPRILFHGRRM